METTFGTIKATQEFESKTKGKKSVLLEQPVTRHYPSGRQNNSLSDNLFDNEEFGFENKDYDSNRTCFIDAPTGKSLEDINAQLAKNPKAKLYRVLGLEPIVTEGQQHAIDNKEYDLTIDKVAERQLVKDENESVVLYKKKYKMYRRVGFSIDGTKADVDTRIADLTAITEIETVEAEEVTELVTEKD